jgi:hypothetical protein
MPKLTSLQLVKRLLCRNDNILNWSARNSGTDVLASFSSFLLGAFLGTNSWQQQPRFCGMVLAPFGSTFPLSENAKKTPSLCA